jgi:RIO kinase 2
MACMLADSSSDACSWLYLSRLAAMKEYAFMVALGEHGLPVPYAVAHNRHCVLMTMVDAVPLVQVFLH